MMTNDPYTLFAALDGSQSASGELYMDDEVSFNHENREEYATASFSASIGESSGTIRNSVDVGSGWAGSEEFESAPGRRIERIVVLGIKASPSSISVGGEALGYTF